jgi:pimeloyl-ACP methyl ester carboxylesterase
MASFCECAVAPAWRIWYPGWMGLVPLAERMMRRALHARGVQSRWIETSIARLHTYDAPGTGPLPTIAVLHGISSSAAAFGSVIQRLRRRARRVLAPEAPGHGFSEAPASPLTPESLIQAMRELLDRELDEPAIVCGNSLGGAVALRYALERPDRVRGLVLTSPAGAAMDQAELDTLLSAFKMRSRADARAFLSRLSRRPPWYTPLIAKDVMRQFSRDVVVSLTGAVRPEHGITPEELGALPMPILLVWGRADRLMPASNLAYFRRHLPAHARIEEPEELGHCPHMDAPRVLAERIAAFAEELVGAAAPARAASSERDAV